MSYNLFDSIRNVEVSNRCLYDSKSAYVANLVNDSDPDGWDEYYGVHTYGCFNRFIFGTVYDPAAYIGRSSPIVPVPSSDFYIIRISMKILSSSSESFAGRVMWRTIQAPVWHSDRSHEFDIINDGKWHDYSIHMGEVYGWQGDINDLRIFPILNAITNDEFFIKHISIDSITTRVCMKSECSYHASYTESCLGTGTRGTLMSGSPTANKFEIFSGVNDLIVVNIDGYGEEHVALGDFSGSGTELAVKLRDRLSETDIGGYYGCNVEFTTSMKFMISSGTYSSHSSVVTYDSPLSRLLGFFDAAGADISIKTVGTDPASQYTPYSSFTVPISKIAGLFKDKDVSVEFDPSRYMIEGGRSDWLQVGLGSSNYQVMVNGTTQLDSTKISNQGKTIIDVCHPINASGRLSKISLCGSLKKESGFITGAKVYIFRPHLDGSLTTIHEISVPDTRTISGTLYTSRQEYIEVVCDVFVSKGDLIGVYNADLYSGKSRDTRYVDALYYHIDGAPTDHFNPGKIYGEGAAGLLLYAHSTERQSRLSIDLDLGHRVSIDSLSVDMSYEDSILEYNIARCVDIDWHVELFGGTYKTGYRRDNNNGTFTDFSFTHTTTAYGTHNLNDGVRTLNEAVTSNSYTVSAQTSVVPAAAKYFFVNGDEEWLGILHHVGTYIFGQYVTEFENDPIAFDIIFPHNSYKSIYRTSVYFKENMNFRNVGLQYYMDSPTISYSNVPSYKYVTLDGTRFGEDLPDYDRVSRYLFANPSQGGAVLKTRDGTEWPPTEGGGGYIDNYMPFLQALQLDWTVLEHEFAPIKCRGFRYFTDFHRSTKINEMELYCLADASTDNVLGAFSIEYSHYDEDWYSADISESDSGLTAFIGDTPRYISVNIEPFKYISLSHLDLSLMGGNVLVDNDCENKVYVNESRTGAQNTANEIRIKNVHGDNYDLYVDLPNEVYNSKSGLILYSKMNDLDSVVHPEVGPDSNVNFTGDYILRNVGGNCAINCYCYGLKNLIDGKRAYSTYDNGFVWKDEGTLFHNEDIGFSNRKDGRITTISVPTTRRSKYWRIATKCKDVTFNVREIDVFKDGIMLDVKFYSDTSTSPEYKEASYEAPHLSNYSITGSYYRLSYTNFITIELDEPTSIDTIKMYHDDVPRFFGTGVGVDEYTAFLLVADSEPMSTNFIDYSYNETDLSYVCAGVCSAGAPIVKTHSYAPDFYDDPSWTVKNEYGLGTGYTVSSGIMDFQIISRACSNDHCSKWIGRGITPSRDHAFELTFSIKLISSGTAGWGAAVGLHEGVHEVHSYIGSSNNRWSWYEGVTMQFLKDGRFCFTVNNRWEDSSSYNNRVSVYQTGCVYNTWYHCRILSDGKGTYTFSVFNDHLDGTQVAGTTIANAYYIRWRGFYVGVGSAGDDEDEWGGIIPTISSMSYGQLKDLSLNTTVVSDMWVNDRRAARFDGSSDSYLAFANNQMMNLRDADAYIDLWVSFDTLPTDYCYLLKCIPGDPLAGTGVGGGWYFYLQESGGKYYIKFTITKNNGANKHTLLNWELSEIAIGKWYYLHLSLEKNDDYMRFRVDGMERLYTPTIWDTDTFDTSYADLEVGRKLNGMMCEVRLSSNKDYVEGTGETHLDFRTYEYNILPSLAYDRLYSFGVYISDDNLYYGLFSVVDSEYESVHSYYDPQNMFSSTYYSYFMIDLGRTYMLDFVRNYGVSGALSINLLNYTVSVDNKSDNPYDLDVSNIEYSILGKISSFMSCAEAETSASYVLSTNRRFFYKVSGFNDPWVGFVFSEPVRPNKVSYTEVYSFTYDELVNVTIQGSNDTNPNWSNKQWTTLMESGVGGLQSQSNNSLSTYSHSYEKFIYIRLIYISTKDSSMGVYNLSMEERNDYRNARWFGVKLLNGDGVSRKICKLGVYPDVSRKLCEDGGHNAEWEYIGSTITNYMPDENAASGATVVASSTFGSLKTSYLTDGIIGTTVHESWGSYNDPTPELIIDLGNECEIYMFRIYHNYTDDNKQFIARDYSIYVSTDGYVYTNVFSITGNDSNVALHRIDPVNARYVKIHVTAFDSSPTVIRVGTEYLTFDGIFIRQIQVIKSKDLEYIESDLYPVVAVNLRSGFSITDVRSTGISLTSTSTDWTVTDIETTYSDSVSSDPINIEFRPWGSAPMIDRWVVVKEQSASYMGGNKYMERLIVSSDGIVNPCDYAWWWASNNSNLYNTYTEVDGISVRSLVIDYQGAGLEDDVRYVGGDTFGVDTSAKTRDGLALFLYVHDISQLDLDYGYIYFGGLDSTPNRNPITYKWYLNNLTSYIDSGWSYLFLRFKEADEIEYTEAIKGSADDIRLPNSVEFTTIGMTFKGVSNELYMILNGFKIERNRFKDASRFDKGLYLCGDDIVSYPISKVNMHSGTIEFWLRPDYNWEGIDMFGTLKCRSLFSFSNNNNDMFGALVSGEGLGIYYGNAFLNASVFYLKDIEAMEIDSLLHLAIVFSCDGTGTTDGSTIIVYINGVEVAKHYEKWIVADSKHMKFILGGQSFMAVKDAYTDASSESLDAVISDLRIYDICKTDFSDSINGVEQCGTSSSLNHSPLIEISRDNINFYSAGDVNLPLEYNGVRENEEVSVFVRTNFDKSHRNNKRTNNLMVIWDIPV